MEVSKFSYSDCSEGRFYIVCDGVIINKAAPFATIAEAKSYIESARERDRLELMLHKRLLKKILRKRCSPDLHDYNVVVEVVV